jgi:hypothetical protein
LLATSSWQSRDLEKKQSEEYHTFVAKGLFACKQTRPDIHPTIAVLCTRVKPNEDNWRKLNQLLKYIKETMEGQIDPFRWQFARDQMVRWLCLFAKSHTGGNMTCGQGIPMSMSRKQKLNTRSSTEAELVGPDNLSSYIDSMELIVHGGPRVWNREEYHLSRQQEYYTTGTKWQEKFKQMNSCLEYLLLLPDWPDPERESGSSGILPNDRNGCWLFQQAIARQVIPDVSKVHHGTLLSFP